MKKANEVPRLKTDGNKYYELFIFSVLMFEFEMFCPEIQHLNPWLTTPYFMSYQDFGLNARVVIGTVFRLFTEYISAKTLYYTIIATIVCMNALAAITFGKIMRRSSEDRRKSLFIFLILFLVCPFSFSYMFYGDNFGVFDIYLVIINFVIMHIVRYKKLRWLIPALCLIAVAIHQGYVMMYMPAVLVILVYETVNNRFKKSDIILFLLTTFAVGSASLYFQFFTPELGFGSSQAVVDFLEQRTDLNLLSDMIFVEYFINVNYWAADGITIVKGFAFKYSAVVISAIFPVILVLLSLWLVAYKNAKSFKEKMTPLLCLLCPLATLPMFVLGMDWDRWLSAVFISQFMLVFYLLDSGFDCVVNSAKKIKEYLCTYKVVLLAIILYMSFSMFSQVRSYSYYISEEIVENYNCGMEMAKATFEEQ